MASGRTYSEVKELSRDRCEELLREHHFGRVAFTAWDGTHILPVSYVFWSGQVVFRTSDEGRLARLRSRTQVAFEIDAIDPERGMAWDVLVRGPSLEITNNWQVGQIWGNPDLIPWMPDMRPLIIAIEPESITGRQLWYRAAEPAG